MSVRFMPFPEEAARELFRDVVNSPDDYPEDVRDKILESLEPGKSISFAVSEAAEIIFARKSELPNRLVRLGAELALTAAHNRINNFADDNGRRGMAIASALRRHSGEKAPQGTSWPPKEEDPSPKEIYLPPVEPDPGVTDVPAPEPVEPAQTERHTGKSER